MGLALALRDDAAMSITLLLDDRYRLPRRTTHPHQVARFRLRLRLGKRPLQVLSPECPRTTASQNLEVVGLVLVCPILISGLTVRDQSADQEFLATPTRQVGAALSAARSRS